MDTCDDFIVPAEAENLADLIASAEHGNADAQYELGKYYSAKNSQYDPSKAFHWFLKAAENGNANAQCRIGGYYHNGEVVEKDILKSEYWYTRAVEQGRTYVFCSLAYLYYDMDKFEKALECLDAYRDLYKIDNDSLRYYIYKGLGRFTEAMKILKRYKGTEYEEYLEFNVQEEFNYVLTQIMKKYPRKPRPNPKCSSNGRSTNPKPDISQYYVGDLFEN